MTTVNVQNPNTFWFPTEAVCSVLNCFEQTKVSEIRTKHSYYRHKFVSEIRTKIVRISDILVHLDRFIYKGGHKQKKLYIKQSSLACPKSEHIVHPRTTKICTISCSNDRSFDFPRCVKSERSVFGCWLYLLTPKLSITYQPAWLPSLV